MHKELDRYIGPGKISQGASVVTMDTSGAGLTDWAVECVLGGGQGECQRVGSFIEHAGFQLKAGRCWQQQRDIHGRTSSSNTVPALSNHILHRSATRERSKDSLASTDPKADHQKRE